MNNDTIKITIEIGDRSQTLYVSEFARQSALNSGIDIAVLSFESALKKFDKMNQPSPQDIVCKSRPAPTPFPWENGESK